MPVTSVSGSASVNTFFVSVSPVGNAENTAVCVVMVPPICKDAKRQVTLAGTTSKLNNPQ
jgi:hypothetical protein